MSLFPILFIAFIVISVVSSSNKKKKAEESRQKLAAQHRAENQPPPSDPRFYDPQPPRPVQQRSARPQPDPRFYDTPAQPARAQSAPAQQGRYAQTGSLSYASTEGMQGDSTEGIGARVSTNVSASVKSRVSHTVRPVTESAHAHEETSITGIMPDCPDETIEEKAVSAPKAPLLRFDHEAVVSGLIYSEILGRPKALRHAR